MQPFHRDRKKNFRFHALAAVLTSAMLSFWCSGAENRNQPDDSATPAYPSGLKRKAGPLLDAETLAEGLAYADLLPLPWPEVVSRLQHGETVFQQGNARQMTVILLAAATPEKLRTEFRRLIVEKKLRLPSRRAAEASLMETQSKGLE